MTPHFFKISGQGSATEKEDGVVIIRGIKRQKVDQEKAATTIKDHYKLLWYSSLSR